MSTVLKILNLINHKPLWIIIVVMSLAYVAKVAVFQETRPDKLWNRGDAIFYQYMGTSLVKDKDLDLSNNHDIMPLYEGHFALSKAGYPTAKQSPLMTIISLPFRWLMGPVGTLWFNIICSLIIILLLYQLLAHWVSPVAACLGSLVVGIGSVLFRYAFNFSPDVFSTLLLIGLLLAAFKKKYLLTSLLAALAISAKIGNIIVVFPIMLYVLWSLRNSTRSEIIKKLAILSITFLLGLLPFMLYNQWLFGSFMENGYQHILYANEQGIPYTHSHTRDFNIPLFQGLGSLLFNMNNGIIKHNIIVVVLMLPGLFFLPKKGHGRLILVGAIALIQLVFYAKYDHQLASHLGNRFLLISIAFMALPVSWFAQWFIDRLKPKVMS